MFRLRLLSAAIGIPAVLFLAWAGNIPFFLLLTVIGLFALREYFNLTDIHSRSARAIGYTAHAMLFLLLYMFGVSQFGAGLVMYFLSVHCFWILAFPRDFRELSALVWGNLYITVLLGFFLLLRSAKGGFALVVAVLAAVWASDSGAYFIGIVIGRRRLLPAVSPKKSVEGALGGLIFAGAVLALIAPYAGMPRHIAVLFGLLLSLAGQIGDLAESALKRWSNTKDSGSFLPGHGGLLDRLDSLLFAAPVAYLLLTVLVKRGVLL